MIHQPQTRRRIQRRLPCCGLVAMMMPSKAEIPAAIPAVMPAIVPTEQSAESGVSLPGKVSKPVTTANAAKAIETQIARDSSPSADLGVRSIRAGLIWGSNSMFLTPPSSFDTARQGTQQERDFGLRPFNLGEYKVRCGESWRPTIAPSSQMLRG